MASVDWVEPSSDPEEVKSQLISDGNNEKEKATDDSNGKGAAEVLNEGLIRAEANEVKKKRSNDPNDELESNDASLIADHYNAIKAVRREERQQSRILHLRNLNNWIKHILIAEFGSRERGIKDVLDLACGKGGDLQKWRKAQVRSWIGVDIAGSSVEEARRRYGEMGGPVFRAEFHVLDAFHKDWAPAIGQNSFHAISCQFAYHYSFETEASARHAIKMVAKYLRPGGYFFGTIPDYREIRRRLMESEDRRKIGNAIFTLELDEGTELEPGFGQRYHFDLAEAIESCPEYFIPFPVLESLAEEVGLEAVLCSPFRQFFEAYSKKREHRESVDRMRLVDGRTGGMAASGDELEVASLYLAFCFRKKKT